jgi:HEAT repeat protein
MRLLRIDSLLLGLTLAAAMMALSPIHELQAAEATIEQLSLNLKSSKAKERRQAAEDLGKTDNHEAVPPLLAAVQDSDVQVRRAAVKALGTLSDSRAITMLLTALNDADETVREEAIVALVNLYAGKDAGFVVTRLAKKVGSTLNPLSDPVGNDPTVVEPYVKVNVSVIEGIAGRLADSSTAIRLDAARALGVLRAKPAIPQMMAAMQTGIPNLQIALLRSFYKIKDASVAVKLIPYIDDLDIDVRNEAILTVGLLKCQEALPQLKQIYEEGSNDQLRLKALQALALIGDASSLEVFRRALTDPDAIRRQYGAEGLARIANAAVLEETSRAFLSEKNAATLLALSYALHQMGRPEYMEKLVFCLNEKARANQVQHYLIEMGKPAVPELETYLSSDSATVRERLCFVLGMIGDASAIEKLKPLLKDDNTEVVASASQAIRRLQVSQ